MTQHPAQVFSRPLKPRFHRTDFAFHHSCDLGQGQFFVLSQYQCFALQRWKLPYCLRDDLHRFASFEIYGLRDELFIVKWFP
jgi:hypothetical protein